MATSAPLIPVVDQAAILNSLAKQEIGSSVVVDDDLSNLIDLGRDYDALDQATKAIVTGKLVTLVTEQLVLVKEYKGNAPDVIRSRETSGYDTSEGIVQKIRPRLPEAVSDADVYDPAVGSTSDPFKNMPIGFETTYFSKPISYRYEWSQPERWLTGAFLSRDAFASTISAISTMVGNALALNVDAITFAQLRASIALNLQDVTATGGPRAFNLLAEFNATSGAATPLLAANILTSPDFLRYATHRIWVVTDYLKQYSVLYNEKNYPNFVTDDSMQMVMHSQFRRAAQQFMLSDVYNEEYLALPNADTVASWKGLILTPDTNPTFESTSLVHDTFDMTTIGEPTVTVDQDGVIAHVFDVERIGIYNLSTRTTSMFDPVGLKTNYFTHVFGRGIVDPYAHGVTFYVAD